MSSLLKPSEIASRLAQRGVRLNPPASSRDINLLTESIGEKIACDFLLIYTLFDGFADGGFDIPSEISLWPIEQILRCRKRQNLSSIDFADFSLDSSIYTYHCGSNGDYIIDQSHKKIVARSVLDFASKIACGFFDF